jgi:large subunit ribosomal protein L30
MIAIVRLRGEVKTIGKIEHTMQLLNLRTVNNCVVVPDNEKYRGMIRKIKDHVTYGEINKETFKKMLIKWGRKGQKRLALKDDEADKIVKEVMDGKKRLKDFEIKPMFRLHPPRGGYEGIKRPYSLKGALGNRKAAINELLERMV